MAQYEAHPTRLKLGIGITLLAFLLLSVASALVWSFRDRFPTIQIIFIQNFVSLLCVAPFAWKRGGLRYLKTEVLPIHFLRDLFGLASYFLFFLAIRYLNLVDATLLNYTAPFFVPFIWRIWRNERIAKSVWWSIVIGFIGMAMILNPTKQIFALGFVYGLFAGLCSAIAFASLRVLNLKGEPAFRTLFYYFSLGTILSLPFALSVWVHPWPSELVQTILIGIFTAGGQLLLTIAYQYGTASHLSPIGYSSIVYNELISYYLFDQKLGWLSFFGTVLIIFGGTMTYILRKKPKTVLESFEEKKPPTPL